MISLKTKIMPIKFDIYPNPTPKKEGSKQMYHARVIAGGVASEKTITSEINKASSLTPGDVMAVLTELRSSIITHLRDGKRVHLPGIGYFELAIESPQIESDEPNFPSKRLKAKTIKFQPEKAMKLDACAGVTFERVNYLKHSANHSVTEDVSQITKIFKDHEIISSKGFADLMDYSQSKAYRILRKLRDEKLVEECGFKNLNLYKATPQLYDSKVKIEL
jgi:predicted histone-like DNA-binding protein